MSDRLFYIETHYQFLQSMSLIIDWVGDEKSFTAERVFFIDATREKEIFSKRKVLKKHFGIDVFCIKVYPFYLSAILSYFLSLRFRKFQGCDFFMFNNRSPVVNKLSSIFSIHGEVIQIEEGLSLYRRPRQVKFPKSAVLFFKRALVSFFTFSRFTDHIGHTIYSDTVYLRYAHLANDNEFLSSKKLVDLPSLKNLSSISSVLNEIYNFDKSLFISFDADCMIYFGQPLSELGLLDRGAELKILKTIGSVSCSMGLRFIVKAHPAEDRTKYDGLGFSLVEGTIPAEVIFLNYSNVKSVISFYSTAALNVSDMLAVTGYFIHEGCGLDVNFPKSENIKSLRSLDPDSLRSEFSRE